MTQKTNTHGGKRIPGPGKKLGRPSTGKPEYLRTPVLAPKTQGQKDAIAWWESLTPRDRLMYIRELHNDCGWPEPRKKIS